MRVRTTSTTVYQFDELEDRAKARARDWFRQCLQSPEDWNADTVIEDGARIADLFGLDLRQRPVKLMGGGTRMEPDCYWSVGDRDQGLSFSASYSYRKGSVRAVETEAPSCWTDPSTQKTTISTSNTEINRIVCELAEVQRRNFYQIYARASHGRSTFAQSMQIDVERADDKPITEEDGEIVRQCLIDVADWLCKNLETEYEYQYSEECVDENIRANEYEFDEDGNRA